MRNLKRYYCAFADFLEFFAYSIFKDLLVAMLLMYICSLTIQFNRHQSQVHGERYAIANWLPLVSDFSLEGGDDGMYGVLCLMEAVQWILSCVI